MPLQTTAALEHLVNGYIYRALLSAEHLEEVSLGFGGLPVQVDDLGNIDRAALAHTIAIKVLGAGWHYEVIQDQLAGVPRVRIVITGGS
jgi:hypothetical protein